MNTTAIGDYGKCVEMKNGDFRLLITTDCGPRIIGAFKGDGPNMMAVLPNEPMDNGTGFRLRGGHRLWHSPEALPRSYVPDDDPVTVDMGEDYAVFQCKPEALTGIQKTIIIEKDGEDSFLINHTLKNCGQFDVTLAPWALTIMAPGGTAIIPHARDAARNPFAPDRSLVLWPYASIADYRLSLEDEYVFLRQDSNATTAVKIGFHTLNGWIAYVNNGNALVKIVPEIDPDDDAKIVFPDYGCNLESYSCDKFCEIETLGNLETIAPGEEACHLEKWMAFAGLPEITKQDDVNKYLVPLIK